MRQHVSKDKEEKKRKAKQGKRRSKRRRGEESCSLVPENRLEKFGKRMLMFERKHLRVRYEELTARQG